MVAVIHTLWKTFFFDSHVSGDICFIWEVKCRKKRSSGRSSSTATHLKPILTPLLVSPLRNSHCGPDVKIPRLLQSISMTYKMCLLTRKAPPSRTEWADKFFEKKKLKGGNKDVKKRSDDVINSSGSEPVKVSVGLWQFSPPFDREVTSSLIPSPPAPVDLSPHKILISLLHGS